MSVLNMEQRLYYKILLALTVYIRTTVLNVSEILDSITLSIFDP